MQQACCITSCPTGPEMHHSARWRANGAACSRWISHHQCGGQLVGPLHSAAQEVKGSSAAIPLCHLKCRSEVHNADSKARRKCFARPMHAPGRSKARGEDEVCLPTKMHMSTCLHAHGQTAARPGFHGGICTQSAQPRTRCSPSARNAKPWIVDADRLLSNSGGSVIRMCRDDGSTSSTAASGSRESSQQLRPTGHNA